MKDDEKPANQNNEGREFTLHPKYEDAFEWLAETSRFLRTRQKVPREIVVEALFELTQSQLAPTVEEVGPDTFAKWQEQVDRFRSELKNHDDHLRSVRDRGYDF